LNRKVIVSGENFDIIDSVTKQNDDQISEKSEEYKESRDLRKS
jgi:hypothetical protein